MVLLTIGLVLFVSFLVGLIARQSVYGLRRDTVLVEDMRYFPHSRRVFQALTGKSGDPFFDGPEGTLVMYEKSFFGRDVKPVYIDRDDKEELPAPANPRASHPLFRSASFRIGIKNYERWRGKQYGLLRRELGAVRDRVSMERLFAEQGIHYIEEGKKRERQNAKEWKDAIDMYGGKK